MLPAKPLLQKHGYQLLNIVGKGSFSKVYRCKNAHKKNDVAVKVTDKTVRGVTEMSVNEYHILQTLNHENIVSVINMLSDKQNIYIIIEFCELGTLTDYIRKRVKLGESMTQYFMQQITQAIQYLHSVNISHMDIKPENMLLSSVFDGIHNKLTLKLGDFAFAERGIGDADISEERIQRCRKRGSAFYLAPEKVCDKPFDARVDLWAIGMVAFECFYGKPYYCNLSVDDVYKLLSNETPILIPAAPAISPNFESLLLSLLTYDRDLRLSFDGLYQHQFIEMDKTNTRENYLKAVRWASRALQLNQVGFSQQAGNLFLNAADLLISFENGETILEKQAEIFVKRSSYIEAAYKIVVGLRLDEKPISLRLAALKIRHFELLYALCKSTGSLQNALDIGKIGEMYMSEKKRLLARNKLMEASKIVLESLQNEPVGTRLTMLHKQFSTWVEYADKLSNMPN